MFEGRDATTRHLTTNMRSMLGGATWWRDELDTRRGEGGYFRDIFEKAPVGMVLEDAGGCLVESNPALQALLGYSEEELLGSLRSDFTYPEDEVKDAKLYEELFQGEREGFRTEKRYVRKDGSVMWGRLSASLLTDAGGRFAFVLSVVEDIDERKKAEEELEESEERYRAVVEQFPLSIYVFSPEGRSLTSNASWSELWGLEEGETPQGTNIFEDEQLIESGLLEYVKESLEGVQVATPPLLYDPARTGREGSPRWLEAYVYPVEDEGGGVREMVLVIEDVTGREEVREELEKSEEWFRAMVSNASDVITVLEPDGTILYDSPAVERTLGYTPDERIGENAFRHVHPDDLGIVREVCEEVARRGGPRTVEYRHRYKDGSSWRFLESVGSKPPDGLGEWPEGIVINSRDVTDRVLAEEELRLKDRAIDASFNGIQIAGPHEEGCPILYVNPHWESMTGYTQEEVLGRNPHFLQGSDRDQPDAKRLRGALEEGREWFGVLRNYRKDGALFYNEMYVSPVRGEGGAITHWVGVHNDITERKGMEEQLAYQAFHDSLTGLPNRALFRDRLDQALARADRHGSTVAVLYMDLDNFKYVNDSLGHEAGDELLIGVAERLRWGVRPGDTAARLGGDEFAVLLEEVGGVEEATKVAERIAEELREPLTIRGQDVFVSTSIGVASSASGRAGDLPRDADAAMYEAKREGKNRYKVFEAGMGHRASERLGLESDLRRAMRRGELRLHYQPEVHLQGGRTVGVEALLRWERPGRGLVPPAEFIPVAEETGLIVPMGHWVLREACRQAREWRGRYTGGEAPTVWVNLSARQLHQADIAGELSGILDEAGLPPEGLGLEITESVLVEYGGTAISTLDKLRALGVKLAIDDFGTGYSSLSYLKRLPVDSLKIDRTFVAGIDKSPEDEVLIAAVINLAQALNLRVVAEGVETPDQLRKLRSLGCDLAQGYLFSRPLPAEEAMPFLEARW